MSLRCRSHIKGSIVLIRADYLFIQNIYIYIYIYIYIVIVVFIWWSPFIPSRNLYDVFTYNHTDLMSLRCRSHIKGSIVLIRADYLFIQNIYIYIVIVVCIWWSPFIPSRNLDDVFTYNHTDLMSLRCRSHIKGSIVLIRADYLFIQNIYIYIYIYILLLLFLFGGVLSSHPGT